MNKKYILWVLVFVVLLIAAIMFLFRGDEEEPVLQSSAAEAEVETEENGGNNFMDHLLGKDESSRDADSEAQPVKESEKPTQNDSGYNEDAVNYPYIQEDGYENGQVTYTDPDTGAVLTVGVSDGVIHGERSGLVLQVQYSQASSQTPYGIRMYTDYGTIGFSKDGKAQALLGSTPFTQVPWPNRTVSGDSVVYLGRTFDLQMRQTYQSSEEFGICWYYGAMEPSLPDSVVIKLHLFNLSELTLEGIYCITLENRNGTYVLAGLEPEDCSELSAAEVSAVQEAALVFLNDNSLYNSGIVHTVDDLTLDCISRPYWSELADADGNAMANNSLPDSGQMVAVTANSHSNSVGPATLYYIVFSGPTQDSEDAPTTTLIGYDWIGQVTWRALMDLNDFDETSITVRQFAPAG